MSNFSASFYTQIECSPGNPKTQTIYPFQNFIPNIIQVCEPQLEQLCGQVSALAEPILRSHRWPQPWGTVVTRRFPATRLHISPRNNIYTMGKATKTMAKYDM